MKGIPYVAAATSAPLLLIGGFFVATAIQPASYNPVRDTISKLAGPGATDSWVMTSALAGVGLCYLPPRSDCSPQEVLAASCSPAEVWRLY